jgi:hypothetical protein
MTAELFHNLFRWERGQNGQPQVIRRDEHPSRIPCPTTGRPLQIATVDAGGPAICPDCGSPSRGAFVSFVADLRMAYACPECRQLIWLAGV